MHPLPVPRSDPRFAILMGLFLLACSPGSSRAEPFAPDPVDALQKAVEGYGEDVSDPVALRAYKEHLGQLARKITSPGDLLRAALMLEMLARQSPDLLRFRNPAAQVRIQVHEEVVKRLLASLRTTLKEGDHVDRLATLTLLANVGGARPPEWRGRAPSKLIAQLGKSLTSDVLDLMEPKEKADIRAAAARALGAIARDPKIAVPALKKLFRARTVKERRAAVTGLDKLLTNAKDRQHTQPRLALMVAMGAAVMAGAPAGFDDEDPQVRRQCLAVVGRLGQWLSDLLPNVEEMHQFDPLPSTDRPLSSEEKARLREYIEQMHGLWRNILPLIDSANEVTPAVGSLLKDTDPSVALSAHQALEHIATSRRALLRLRATLPRLPEPSLPLEARLGGPGPEKKRETPFTDRLGQNLRALVPGLAKSLSHDEVRVRLASLYVLEELGPDAAPAAPALVKALKDENSFVRWGAVRVVGKMAPREAARVVPGLALLLSDENRDVRITVTAALKQYGPAIKDGDTIQAVARVLRRGDREMRPLAIGVLVAIGQAARPAVPALIQALTDSEPTVRAAAARALGQFGASDACIRKALARALEDPHGDVRKAAAAAILSERK
jgi:HEAT repeat protein